MSRVRFVHKLIETIEENDFSECQCIYFLRYGHDCLGLTPLMEKSNAFEMGVMAPNDVMGSLFFKLIRHILDEHDLQFQGNMNTFITTVRLPITKRTVEGKTHIKGEYYTRKLYQSAEKHTICKPLSEIDIWTWPKIKNYLLDMIGEYDDV